MACFYSVQGPSKHHVFLHDVNKMRNQEYFIFGKVVALAILHGYDPPHMFSQGLAAYVVGNPECKCLVEDIPDPTVQHNLQRLITADESVFASLRDELFPDRVDYGFHKYSPTKATVMEFAHAVAHEMQISKNVEEIHSFMQGLSTNEVLRAMIHDKSKAEQLLTYDASLVTVEKVKAVFRVKYLGSDATLDQEQDIYSNFITFLEEFGVGKVVTHTVLNLEDIEAEEKEIREEEKTFDLFGILRYLTGSQYINTNGEKIDISFVDEERRLQVNTCSFKIEFPLTARYSVDNNKIFTANIMEDFLNSPGFGQA